MTQAVGDPPGDEHPRYCPRYNRRVAICTLVASAIVTASSAHGIAKPFPAEINPVASQFEIAAVDAVLVWLYLVRYRCRHERLWLGLALAGGLLILFEAFLPGFGGAGSIVVNGACTVLWLAATVVSVGFVRSAFKATPGRGIPSPGESSGSSGDAQPECPACGSRLACRTVKLASPFHCPACSAELSVRPSYRWSSPLLGLILAGGIAALLGPTGPSFAVACIAAWIPAAWAVAVIAKRLVPPQPVLRGAESVGKPNSPSG